MPSLFADARVALGIGDPGGLSPLTGVAQNATTDRWYDSIPDFYVDADSADDSTAGGWPLYAFMDAVCSPLVVPLALGERIAAGQFTDPAAADAAWVPWLAAAVGLYGSTVAEQRTALATLLSAPAMGSAAYLTILAQSFLTGTKYAVVTGEPPWGIQLRVRADELGSYPSAAALGVALVATGRIPSGFTLSVITDQETWAQLAVALPTWAPAEGVAWRRVDSMGLTGAGTAIGSVTWAGTAL